MYTFSFERLEVWNKSRQLAKSTYKVTQSFPDSEKFGIVSQLRRAVVSICSNIAEGSSRRSKKGSGTLLQYCILKFDGSTKSTHYQQRSGLS